MSLFVDIQDFSSCPSFSDIFDFILSGTDQTKRRKGDLVKEQNGPFSDTQRHLVQEKETV